MEQHESTHIDPASLTLVVSTRRVDNLILQDDNPEPIKNAFEDPNAPPEEKTMQPFGPANDVPMLESTQAAGGDGPVEKVEDTRAPVGLDAGAPEVTDAAEDGGGWHGGAEDVGNAQEEIVIQRDEREAVRSTVQTLEVDDEARRLAEAAMRAEDDI